MRLVILFLMIFIFTGCGGYISRYSFICEETNTSVHQLANETTAAKSLILKNETYARYRHLYEDEYVKIHLDCEPNRIGIYVINKSNQQFKIFGDSLKIYSEHLTDSSLTIINSNKDTILLPNSTWMNEIILKKDLLPYKSNDRNTLGEKSTAVLGKKIKLFMPINISEHTKYYNFIFTPKDFQILSK